MAFIHEKKLWPAFHWDDRAVLQALVPTRHAQGLFLGWMRAHGFDLQTETALRVLTSDVVQSSAIEGERLDAAEVRKCRRPSGLLEYIKHTNEPKGLPAVPLSFQSGDHQATHTHGSSVGPHILVTSIIAATPSFPRKPAINAVRQAE